MKMEHILVKDKVIVLAGQNKGYINSKILKEHGIPNVYLTRLVKDKRLEKVCKGIYVIPDTVVDQFYIYALKYRHIVYSGETALFLNGLSSKQSSPVEITLPYGVNVPRIDGVTVIVSRSDNVGLGVTLLETPFGNEVRSYDMERSICDLFIRPDHYDAEDRNFAIKEYSRHNLNLEKLYNYAKQLKVYEKIKNVFEVISWN